MGGRGKAPHLKGGLGAKPPSLGCFCVYVGGCQDISAPFILPIQNPRFPTGPPKLVEWLEGFYSSLSRVILVNFKEKYRKKDVEEWFCSSLSRVILVIFIFFFRVNDNTMRSYYRYVR